MKNISRKLIYAWLIMMMCTSVVFVQNASAVTYPPISVTYTDFEWITNVTFGAINNDSLDEGYADFTLGMSASVSPGVSYLLSVTIDPSTIQEPGDGENISAFFDWDADGVFEDEVVVATLVDTVGPHTAMVAVPPTAVLGESRMRVVLSWIAPPVSFGTIVDGEVEDYTIYTPGPTITATAGLNGTITPSGVVQKLTGDSQLFTITPDASYSVTDVLVDGVSVGAVPSYVFNNITASHTISATFGQTFWPGISSSNFSEEWITNVSFEAINNTSAAEGYGDFTGIPPATVSPGMAYLLSVAINPSIDGDENISVFFDWNIDGDFTDPGEEVVVAEFVAIPGPHPFPPKDPLSVTVPADAVGGETRMRVVLRYFDPPSSSGVIDWGEAEDYTVNVRHVIMASTVGNGTITPSGAVPVVSGTDQIFAIAPAANNHLVDVLVDGVSVGPVISYTFTNVTAAHTIVATFAIDTNTITATAGVNGSISPSGAIVVDYGGSQAFAIVPIANHHVLDVLVNGISVGAVASHTFTNVTTSHTIEASFAIDAFIISATAGANGSISPNGDVSVVHGTSQGFTIAPVANYSIADVLVDGVSVGAVTSYDFINVTANHTIEASFIINAYTITASVGSNGSITPSGGVLVNHGSNQAFSIAPGANHHVADVLVDSVSVGAVTSYTFTNVTAGHTITASFAIDTNVITATAGDNGVISPSGAVPVDYDGSQGFSITPDTNYHVADVLVDSVSVGAVSSYSFTNVTAGHTIEASFAIDTNVITATAGDNGAISPSGAVPVNYGSSRFFTITPVSNYHVADVMVDGVSVGAVNSYNFTNVTAAHTITASFAIDTYTINASAGATGLINPSGGVSVNHGSDQGFTITPFTNYHVLDVLVDGASVGAVTSYTFTNVTAAHTIAASFAIDTYTITASVAGNGAITPNGGVSVNHGSGQSFTMTPATNHHVEDVLVDGVSVGPVSSYTFTNVTVAHTIMVSFTIDTYTITASVVGNGSISPAGGTIVNHGGNQGITISPGANHHVTDVHVDGVSVGAVTSYPFTNVTASHIITASFAIDTYTITATAIGNGSIDPAGAISIDHGGNRVFTMTPDVNYNIVDVLVDGVSEGAVASYTFTNVDASHTITVNYTIGTHVITASTVGNGLIGPSGSVSVDHGNNQAFSITPAVNHHVAEVLVDSVSVGAVTSYNFTSVVAPHTIAVTFAIDTYVVTASSVGNGLVDPSGGVSVDHGSDQAFTITPDANHHVVNVLVDGVSVGAVSSYTFTSVTTPHTIAVTFAIDTYTITSSTGANGTVSPLGPVSVDHGSDQLFTITPVAHYHVVDVRVDDVSVGVVASHTFTNVTAPHTITATFAIDTFTVTPIAGGNGSMNPDTPQVVSYGDVTAFSMIPDIGYHTDVVTGCDGTLAGNLFTTGPVAADCSVTSSFAIDTFSLNVEKTGSGFGDVTSAVEGIECDGECSEVYDYGTEVTLTAVPKEGSTFKGWSGDCEGTDPVCTVTVDQEKTVSVEFYAFPWSTFIPIFTSAAAAK
jgi:uncharacterized repeat protein (TIGR02543 family)